MYFAIQLLFKWVREFISNEKIYKCSKFKNNRCVPDWLFLVLIRVIQFFHFDRTNMHLSSLCCGVSLACCFKLINYFHTSETISFLAFLTRRSMSSKSVFHSFSVGYHIARQSYWAFKWIEKEEEEKRWDTEDFGKRYMVLTVSCFTDVDGDVVLEIS